SSSCDRKGGRSPLGWTRPLTRASAKAELPPRRDARLRSSRCASPGPGPPDRRIPTLWSARVRVARGRRRRSLDRPRALEPELALARVPREERRALELAPRLRPATPLGQQIPAHARQQAVGSERTMVCELVD